MQLQQPAAAWARLTFLQLLISTGLQPGVCICAGSKPFQRLGSVAAGKRLKPFLTRASARTRLKPGANERIHRVQETEMRPSAFRHPLPPCQYFASGVEDIP